MFTATTPLAKKIAARAESRTGSSMKSLAEGRSDVFRVNPFLIKIEAGFNTREIEATATQEHIDELAQSIAKIGVQRPLKIRNKGGEMLLKDGECRLRATIRAIEVYGAEIVSVPVLLADRSESDADSALGILVENSGLPLTPLAKAAVVTRLKGFGWSDEDIAAKAGMSKARVLQLLELNGLGEEVKTLIRTEVVSPTLAVDIARSNKWDDEATVAEIKAAQTEVAARGKTRVTAKAVVSKVKPITVVTDILSAAVVSSDGENVTVSMSREEWEQVRAALKIDA